jgi:DNA-binding MarR family transcriptional regulator
LDAGRPGGSIDEFIRDISWGYRPAILLLTANRLHIFDALAGEPSTAPRLAERLGLDERALTILLDALAALGLLRKSGGRYRCGAAVKAHLVTGGKRFQGNILEHRFNILQRWIDLPRVVREGGPAKIMRSRRTPEEWRAFILAMVDVSGTAAGAFVGALDLSGRKKLLDLGGGPGTYSIALCERYTDLHATLFDLPETVPIAKEQIERHGLTGRIETRAGDYMADPLGEGYDLLLVSNIVHSLSFDEIVRLLSRARSAMIPGGLAIVRDFRLDESRTRPLESALFAVNMLVSTDGGNCYTPSEMKESLRRAGFARIRVKPISPVASLYIGSIPKQRGRTRRSGRRSERRRP